MYKLFVTSLCLFLFLIGFTQEDSLIQLYKNAGNDNQKQKVAAKLAQHYYTKNPQLCDSFGNISLSLIGKTGNRKDEATVHLIMGNNSYMLSHFDSSLYHYEMALKANQRKKNEEGVALALSNIGLVHINRGDFSSGLEYQLKAYEIYEKLKKLDYMAGCLNAIAVIYKEKKDYKKALQYQFESLKLNEELKDDLGIANNHVNIGNLYLELKKISLAQKYLTMSLTRAEKNGDQYTRGIALHSFGELYVEMKEYGTAIYYFEKAKKVQESAGDLLGLAGTYLNLGLIDIEKKKYLSAVTNLNKSLEIAETYQIHSMISESSNGIYLAYVKLGEPQKALPFLERHIRIKDSLLELESKSKLLEIQEKFDSESKEKQILELQNKRVNDQLQSEIDKSIRNLMIGGLILIGSLLLFFILRYRSKRISSKKIEEAYQEVKIKQNEILDSINYAQRLQQAILAMETDIKKYLPNSFLFYLPKDIVAGDFYFFESTKTHIFYAAADCTGHGVPGALMSIVCSNALSKCIKEFSMQDPGKILGKTREIILETFAKSGQDVKDGMDISLCVFKINNNKNSDINFSQFEEIHWAGANNPLWFIDQGELKEIKADKQPIGKTDDVAPFTTHLLPSSVSTLYLFTDGYADQFGGPKGKKFKYSNLQKLLLELNQDKMETQREKLESTFNTWKGELEQVDDVCIIGIKK